jgi:hypothetical protein
MRLILIWRYSHNKAILKSLTMEATENEKETMPLAEKLVLIEALLKNRISTSQLALLREHINSKDLAEIIRKIYDLNNTQVNEIAALEKAMGFVDGLKNANRNNRFNAKIKDNFRKAVKDKKVILAEGDSWFNYPVILSDVIDWIGMEDNMAIYSLANGGDWLLNMLNGRKYVEELSVIHPDVFLISGGGNDLVGRSRVSAIVNPKPSMTEYNASPWAQELVNGSTLKAEVGYNDGRFKNGVQYLSKDFYALLMFFSLQYYSLINGILTAGTDDGKNGKFPDIVVITQGYDYALPSHSLSVFRNPLHWYRPFIRKFLGHGSWLKTPLQLRGILNKKDQEDIVYAMIYLFNEMMISNGKLFCAIPNVGPKVFHIDSRGAVGEEGWTDELHPLPENFKRIGQTFIDCINGEPNDPKYGQVFIVNKRYPKKA